MTEPISDQGWTQYQKLVLAELERHDDRQTSLEKDLIDLKLSQAKLTLELSNILASIKNLEINFKESLEEHKEAGKQAIEQRIDIGQLKLKFGWLCAIIGIASGAGGAQLFEVISRLFGH